MHVTPDAPSEENHSLHQADEGNHFATPTPPPARRRTLWQRITGSRFLFISILVHVLFALAATAWVVQTITTKRKLTFTSAPPSPNPSQRAMEHQVQMAKKQQTMSAPAMPKHIVSTGMAKVTLPEMPAMPAMNSIAAPTKMAGMGGTGFGLGPSAGVIGSGGGGGGGPVPFFGFRSQPGIGALVGNFYDLKQDRSRKPTGMTPQKYAQTITEFLKSGWHDSEFSRFFKSPQPVYTPQIFIPNLPADQGPAAFQLEKIVQPGMWIVHYKGRVSPPESGTYHFVGAGDDVLLVKFDNKLVLARCWDNPSFGVIETNWKPVADYDYGFSLIPKGFAKGDAIQVQAGEFYPMEVLIGEQPGGSTFASLLIEKEGVDYKKDAKGNPILPVFRLTNTKLPDKGEFPPHTDDGPIWKAEKLSAGGGTGLDFFHKE